MLAKNINIFFKKNNIFATKYFQKNYYQKIVEISLLLHQNNIEKIIIFWSKISLFQFP